MIAYGFACQWYVSVIMWIRWYSCDMLGMWTRVTTYDQYMINLTCVYTCMHMKGSVVCMHVISHDRYLSCDITWFGLLYLLRCEIICAHTSTYDSLFRDALACMLPCVGLLRRAYSLERPLQLPPNLFVNCHETCYRPCNHWKPHISRMGLTLGSR